jgi:hypothetical protein
MLLEHAFHFCRQTPPGKEKQEENQYQPNRTDPRDDARTDPDGIAVEVVSRE